jgi:hypothetical protein
LLRKIVNKAKPTVNQLKIGVLRGRVVKSLRFDNSALEGLDRTALFVILHRLYLKNSHIYQTEKRQCRRSKRVCPPREMGSAAESPVEKPSLKVACGVVWVKPRFGFEVVAQIGSAPLRLV